RFRYCGRPTLIYFVGSSTVTSAEWVVPICSKSVAESPLLWYKRNLHSNWPEAFGALSTPGGGGGPIGIGGAAAGGGAAGGGGAASRGPAAKSRAMAGISRRHRMAQPSEAGWTLAETARRTFPPENTI